MILKKEKETDIQRTICDYLALKKYFFWRQNTVPIFADGKFRSMPKYSMSGVPDIILIKKGGVVCFLEVKRKTGKLSPSQVEFFKKCTLVGADYNVVKSLDDVLALGL